MSLLSLNYPNLHCHVKDICNTKFFKVKNLYEGCMNCEIDSISFNYEFDYAYDLEFNSEFYYDSEFTKESYSYCELYFKFENKTEFVFLIDHLELWLFSHRNFTVHSNQFIKESGNSFFSRR